MQVESFNKLYLDQLRDVYNAEKQLVRALPKMVKGANSPELRSALEEHLEQTRHHVERLEEIFSDLGRPATGKTCKGMAGIIEEGQEILDEDSDPAVQDAGIIAAAQRVEHYEIATYGTLRTFAEQKGERKAAQLLEETLKEEKRADQKLTDIAESSVNIQARDTDSMDEESRGTRDRTSGRPGDEEYRREPGHRAGDRDKGDGPWV